MAQADLTRVDCSWATETFLAFRKSVMLSRGRPQAQNINGARAQAPPRCGGLELESGTKLRR
jgi:hypothetical protein